MEKLENLKLFLFEHRLLLVVMLVITILFGIGGFYLYQNLAYSNSTSVDNNIFTQSSDVIVSDTQELLDEESCYITIDIKGEIKKPGVYQIKCNSRVQDVISLAGGITSKADTSVLNLSKKLIDEMVIIVYSKEQVSNFVAVKDEEKQKIELCQSQNEIQNDACIDDKTSSNNEIIGDTPVNNTISLNIASKEQLMTLPGIGESKADNIISYRDEIGSFKNIEELKNVKGIGDSIFEKIKANITI